jgi:hypothetical protein
MTNFSSQMGEALAPRNTGTNQAPSGIASIVTGGRSAPVVTAGFRSSPPPAYKPPADKTVELHEPDGTPYKTFVIPSMYGEWLPLALRHYPPGATDTSVRIPRDKCSFTYGIPKFNACTFEATDNYLAARWGRKLHHTDRQWLSLHPFASDDGVPTEYTLICLQQLLEPYGMAISAVRMRQGALAASKHIMQFAAALGCNPLGLFDHRTTNEEAAEKLGVDLAKAEKMWRFEFHEEPLPGCTVVCERGMSSTSEYSTGFAGGHARYMAPRDRYGNWVLSVQFAPVEQVTYDAPITLPEYVERKGEETLDLNRVLQPDGVKFVGIKVNNWYKDPDEVAAEEAARKSGTFSEQKVQETQETKVGTTSPVESLTRRRICFLCYKEQPEFVMEFGADCCSACYIKAWKGFKCSSCNTKFGASQVPTFIERFEEGKFGRFACPGDKCGVKIKVFEDEKNAPGLGLMLRTYPASDKK